MITLSNGHILEYVAASGALGFFGEGWPQEKPLIWSGRLNPALFTVFAKTVTRRARRGNLRWYWPCRCIRLLKRGVVNSVGLTNPGFFWWLRKFEKGRGSIVPLIPSIFLDSKNTLGQLSLMAEFLERLTHSSETTSSIRPPKGLELNLSCPNTEDGILSNTEMVIKSCQAVKASAPSLTLILKISVVHDIDGILPSIKGTVEAISINSVPWDLVFPNQESPLAHLGGGGVSGGEAQAHTWDLVKRLVKKTDIPVIGPSVWDYEDIEILRDIGASAISFGSIFLRYPWRPAEYVRKDMERNTNC